MQILNYTQQPAGSYALATFDIYMGPQWGVTYRNFKLCRSKKGHLYIKPPTYKKGEFEGKPTWGDYIEFSPERGKEFKDRVMELLKSFTT